MKFKAISFDMQGTLTPLKFSEEFWQETLPALYAESQKIEVQQAKEFVYQKYVQFGKYDRQYYSIEYWLENLGLELSPEQALARVRSQPEFFQDIISLVRALQGKATLCVTSTAAREFINLELGENKGLFDHTFSAVSDFNMGGKPPELYSKICAILNAPPEKVLHVGDDLEMDVQNPKKAGLATFYFDPKEPREKLLSELKKTIKNTQK